MEWIWQGVALPFQPFLGIVILSDSRTQPADAGDLAAFIIQSTLIQGSASLAIGHLLGIRSRS